MAFEDGDLRKQLNWAKCRNNRTSQQGQCPYKWWHQRAYLCCFYPDSCKYIIRNQPSITISRTESSPHIVTIHLHNDLSTMETAILVLKEKYPRIL